MSAGIDATEVVKIALSSAVVSNLINVGWNAWTKRQDRKRDAEKELLQLNHVYLEVAWQLEAFAHRCNERVNKILAGLSYAEQFSDDVMLQNIAPVQFEFDPAPDWSALPVSFTAKIKALPKQFSSSVDWINEAYEYWASTPEALEFEVERLSYYGKQACQEATTLRNQIGAGDGQIGAPLANFNAVIESRKKRYLEYPENVELIPELKQLFVSEQEPA